MIKSLKSLIYDLLYNRLGQDARVCLLCGGPGGKGHICPRCRGHLTSEKINGSDRFFRCSICGRYTLDKTSFHHICSECTESPPPFGLARSAGPYQDILKDALYALKYQKKRGLAHELGKLMGEVFLKERHFWKAEILVPVPLSKTKEMSRGFNQSQLLAQALGDFLKLPVANAMSRNRDTEKQSQLNRRERIRNMAGIFSTDKTVYQKKILLIDDIFTTGATAGECSRVLILAGALEVNVLTAASGIRQK